MDEETEGRALQEEEGNFFLHLNRQKMVLCDVKFTSCFRTNAP